MIAIRLSDCADRPYADILRILHAPQTEQVALALKRLLPDLKPAAALRETFIAGGRLWVHGNLAGWNPKAEAPPVTGPGPSLLSKALHLAGTLRNVASDVLAGRDPIAEADEISRRIGICNECPMLTAGKCSRCGCPVERKAAVASEHCPDGRW